MLAYGIHIAIKGVEEHVLGAQALQGLEVSVDLVQRALAGNPLLFGEWRLGQTQPNAWAQRRQRLALGSDELLQTRQPGVSQPVNTDANRMPGISIANRSSQGRIACNRRV